LPLFIQRRPQWIQTFVPEEVADDEETSRNDNKTSSISAIALATFSLLAVAIQIVKLTLPGPQLYAILLLISWTFATLIIALNRPRYCPSSLLAFYFPALVAELSASKSWNTQPSRESITNHIPTALCAFSIAVILYMPLRPISPSSGPISGVRTTPKNTERSPEDSLRLWQFLTVSWIWPLLVIGKERQMQNEDIWLLGYDFQTRRLANAFREIRGSTVLKRLLKANGIDCCVLILIAFIQLFCGMFVPKISLWKQGLLE
jgi:hypothetical protein